MARNPHRSVTTGASLLVVSTAALLTACGGSSSSSSDNPDNPGTSDTPDTSVACAASPPYQIGDEGPSGGLIFFVDEDDRHDFTYLEAAPEDLSGNSDSLHMWSAQWLNLGAVTSESVGTGATNTQLILNASENQNIAAPAAERTAEATLGGCDDWFLPSRGELTLMHENLQEHGLGGFGGDTAAAFDYWTSSEAGLTYAWGRAFNGSMDGFEYEWRKDYRFRVRPARAF